MYSYRMIPFGYVGYSTVAYDMGDTNVPAHLEVTYWSYAYKQKGNATCVRSSAIGVGIGMLIILVVHVMFHIA